MPSTGATAIANVIGAKSYIVEGGFATLFINSGEFVLKLANAIHAGWTSVSPTTPTSMAASFALEFNGYLFGNGLLFINCVATSIDDEIATWVASWNVLTSVHDYTVNAASIVSRIMVCTPVVSYGTRALAEAVADAFMSGFGQEAG
jgi:hypothetical protein